VSNNKISALVETYHKSLPEKADEIFATWQAVEAESFSPSSIVELKTLMHKIAGSAGMYGYSELSSEASKIEQILILELDERSSGEGISSQQWSDATGESVATFVQLLRTQHENGIDAVVGKNASENNSENE